MKKKLIIIYEGKTEQFFCEKLLLHHFAAFYIEIEHPLITHSNGGIVKWSFLKKQVMLTLQSNTNCLVTTFIDFYGIKSRHDFPGWDAAIALEKNDEKMRQLEGEMLNDLDEAFRDRFIPYVQLYEFEALVFSEYKSFIAYYTEREANFKELQAICTTFANPEEINDTPKTTPSKSLNAHIKGYDKYADGIDICELTGLTKIRSKCLRFNEWITKLENI